MHWSKVLIDSHIHFCDHYRLDQLVRYCRNIGAERIAVLSLPLRRRINFNPEVLLAKAYFPRKYYALGSFDFSALSDGGPEQDRAAATIDLAAQVRRLWRLGCDGLKIFAGKPTFQRQLGLRLDGPLFLAGFRQAERLGLTAVVHVADPPVFWTGASGPGFRPPLWQTGDRRQGEALPGYEQLQGQALAVLEACPDLRVVFPHLLMMAHDLDRLGCILERHRNVWIDLAPGLYFYGELNRDRRRSREFFHTFRDRILFGSDGMWFAPRFSEITGTGFSHNLQRSQFLLRYLQTEDQMDNPFVPGREERPLVKGLGLKRETLDAICGTSFLAAFSRSPRPIDRGGCLAYIREFQSKLAAGGAEASDRGTVRDAYAAFAAAPGEHTE